MERLARDMTIRAEQSRGHRSEQCSGSQALLTRVLNHCVDRLMFPMGLVSIQLTEKQATVLSTGTVHVAL